MATPVDGDLYMRLDGQLHELKRQIRLKGGYPYDPAALSAALQALIEGRFPEIQKHEHGKPSPFFPGSRVFCGMNPSELIPGWTREIVEDVEPREHLMVSDLFFVSPIDEGGDWITGQEMRSWSRQCGVNFGLADAITLLDQQADIPEEVRGKWILLPGTVLQGHDGDLRVPCLDWDGSEWFLGFVWLDDIWGQGVRFALSK